MTRAVAGVGTPARVLDAIASISGLELRHFLLSQRWFAGKAAGTENDSSSIFHVASPVVMPWGNGRFAIVRVAADVRGRPQTYQLPIAVGDELPDEAPATARISVRPGEVVFDAVYDPEFRGGLADAVSSRGASAMCDDGTRWIVHPLRPAPAHRDASTRLGSAEQSNTSIVVDYGIVIKLFRLLTPGTHPDAEVGEFLTARAEFMNTPALLATIRMEDGDAGEITTTGIAHVFLPQSTDAWTFALEESAAYFAAPPEVDLPIPFTSHATRLGDVTRRMHEALSSGGRTTDSAFTPEPATDEDLESWADRARDAVHHALALLEEQLAASRIPRARTAEAAVLVKRRDHYLSWIDEKVDGLDDDLGMRTRIHGDFHLGQVLRTANDDFMIIDFEGEPSKSIEERREKSSPLRDVAGMLRSIGYAAATLAASVEKTVDAPTRELRAGRWERDIRAAYLAGYLGPSADAGPRLLPESLENTDRLMAVFEAEKAFYELGYELNNRPPWAWIPMRGIAKLLAR